MKQLCGDMEADIYIYMDPLHATPMETAFLGVGLVVPPYLCAKFVQ